MATAELFSRHQYNSEASREGARQSSSPHTQVGGSRGDIGSGGDVGSGCDGGAEVLVVE